MYDGPFTPEHIAALKASRCPFCGSDLYPKEAMIYCQQVIDDSEGGETGCQFWTSQAYAQGWIGTNPWSFDVKLINREPPA